MAYAELVSCIPAFEAGQTHDEIIQFQLNCEKKDRPAFYIDFIAHFCKHTVQDTEKMSSLYLDIIFKYMNHPNAELVAKVVNAFDSIMTRLPKEA